MSGGARAEFVCGIADAAMPQEPAQQDLRQRVIPNPYNTGVPRTSGYSLFDRRGLDLRRQRPRVDRWNPRC